MEIYKKEHDYYNEFIVIKKRSYAITINIETGIRETIPINYFKEHFVYYRSLYRCQVKKDVLEDLLFARNSTGIEFVYLNKNNISKRIRNYINKNDLITFFNTNNNETITLKMCYMHTTNCFVFITRKYKDIKKILDREKELQKRELPINGKSSN